MKNYKKIWEVSDQSRVIDGVKFKIEDDKLYIGEEELEFKSLKLLKIIGSGANAIILKAREEISSRECAIKVWFSKDKISGYLHIDKHKKEVEKIANFDNDLIVKYYSADSINDYIYCTMEYIEGNTLREHLSMYNPNLSDRYEIMTQIIKALRNAHEKNIYHGDLHDRNILVTEDNKLKVLDFGTSLGKKEFSTKRDSKLMYKLGKEVMGEYSYKQLMWLNRRKIDELSPRTVRLMLEGMSKIIVMLDNLKHGVTSAVIEDIALFATIIPFFNIKYLTKMIEKYSDDEEKIDNITFFINELSNRVIDRLCLYNISKKSPTNEKELEFVYNIINDKFVETTEKYLEEKYIYTDIDEVNIFKGGLYHRSISVDPKEDMRLKAIESALEMY